MRILGYYVGAVEALIAVNVLVFLLASILPQWAIILLALTPATVMLEPWTLLTSMFLHVEFYHLLFNMISLYFFGGYLMQIIGEKDLLLVYFIGGIAGGLFFVSTALLGLTDPLVSAVGASGAIFALGGALAVLRPNMMVVMLPVPFPMPLWMAVFGFMVFLSFLPGIAWQGHLGGLIAGAFYGRMQKKKYSVQVYDYYR